MKPLRVFSNISPLQRASVPLGLRVACGNCIGTFFYLISVDLDAPFIQMLENMAQVHFVDYMLSVYELTAMKA